jgi:predicted nucleotidyltransferase
VTRQQILDRLRANEGVLRARGVAHAALFGSGARGDERVDSDTDIMIDVSPDARMSVCDYVGLKEFIASLFDAQVDAVSRQILKPYVRPAAATLRAQFAVTRCLEIISEASRRLSVSLKDRHPSIPWRRMAAAGNVYRHDYEDVAAQFVWDAVQNEPPPF